MGTYHPSTGKFDLTVWFQYDAYNSPTPFDPTEIDAWKKSFERASELLYAATDGQHQLGTVSYAYEAADDVPADALLYRDQGESNSTGARFDNDEPMKLMNDEKTRPFIILHELGHYLYDLGDEYEGPPSSPGLSPVDASCLGRFTNDDGDDVLPGACVMEGGWKDGLHFGDGGYSVGGAENPGTVTDFCVACNHDKGGETDCDDGLAETDHDDNPGDTWQEDRHHESCWETIHDAHPEISMPGERPDPEEPVPGPDPIKWVKYKLVPQIVVMVDTSNGFSFHPPWMYDDARQAVLDWLDRSGKNDELGGVAFNRDVISAGLVPVRQIPRRPLMGYLDSLEYGGRCAMGKALRAAIEMFDRADGPGSIRDIVLLSVAENSVDPHPLRALPALRERGIRVHAVGLLPTCDVDLLTSLTAGTGGMLILVPPVPLGPPQPIRRAMARIFAHTHGTGGGAPVLPPNPGGSDGEAFVEEDCREATFSASWPGEEAGAFELSIEEPGGRRITAESTDPDVDAGPDDRPFRRIRVLKPRAGRWKLHVTGERHPDLEPELFAMPVNPRVRFTAGARRARVARGEKVRLEAMASFGRPATGLTVRGNVTGPDGEREEIELFDDGLEKHGSERANSGHYVNLWVPPREGIYTFDLVADNRDGRALVAASGNDGTNGTTSPGLIGSFLRRALFTLIVGEPIGDDPRASPERLRQGERSTLRVRLDGRPWIPGVSRLGLGAGVGVTERPQDSTPEEAVFEVAVDDGAPPGLRKGRIVTQGGRYAIEDVAEVVGGEPEPYAVSAERFRYPGRFWLRILRGWNKEE